MELMVLKIPPDKAAKVADAIERDLARDSWDEDTTDLQATLTWLRYRVAKWRAEHPETAQE